MVDMFNLIVTFFLTEMKIQNTSKEEIYRIIG